MINELKAVQTELEKDIISKIDTIKEKIRTGAGPGEHMQLEMLAMVNDELSDVLLNWDPRFLENNLGDELL